MHKLLIAWTQPLDEDLDLDGLLTLPAKRRPQRGDGLRALALSRYGTLAMSEDAAELERLAGALARRDDALTSDASCSIASARLTGQHAGELLSRGMFLDIAGFAEGEYARTRLDQAAVIVHRTGNGFWLHWPDALSGYIGLWMRTVTSLERAERG